jgi:hypothetical protein
VSRLLLVEPDDTRRAELSELLQGLGTIEACATLQPPDSAKHDLVIADYDTLPDPDREQLVKTFSGPPDTPRLLLFSEGGVKKDFARLFGERVLTNLVAFNDRRPDRSELNVTVRKILERDIFGIEKYFPLTMSPQVVHIRKSTDKDGIVDAAERFATEFKVQKRLVTLFQTVADELVTNAVYNAPLDSTGKSRYGHVSRTQEVALEPGEEVEVRFCCDRLRLGISVRDPFGSLTQERLLDNLARCFRRAEVEQKEGGAGLGLYVVLESLSQFVVNIAPGKRTEMIGLIDVSGSYKDFASRKKSFNLFVADRG